MPQDLFPVNAGHTPSTGTAPASSTGPDPVPLLALLAGMGAIPGLIPALAEMSGLALSADERRYLEGPIVLHAAGGWEADVPGWMFHQVRAERVEIVLGRSPLTVGPTELAAVMMPATYEAPLPHDLCELYLWGAVHAYARHAGTDPAERWAALDHHPVTDRDMLPGGRLRHAYEPLAASIRRRVIALAPAAGRAGTPARERGAVPPAPAPGRTGAAPRGGEPPAPILSDLFDFLA